MSIFQLDASPNKAIDSRFIQYIDIIVQNIGDRPFDVLIEGHSQGTLFVRSLNHLPPALPAHTEIVIPNQMTNYQPIQLQVITNISNPQITNIIVQAYDRGMLIAVISKEPHFTLIDSN